MWSLSVRGGGGQWSAAREGISTARTGKNADAETAAAQTGQTEKAEETEQAGQAARTGHTGQEIKKSESDLLTPLQREEDAPSIWEMIKEAREKAEAYQKQLNKMKGSVNYGEIPIEAYARLNRAQNRQEVGAAKGYAWRQISRLKAALRQDADNEAAIRAALAQLNKAVCRAGRKQRRLEQEQVVRVRRKKAEERRRRREELRLGQELKRRMVSRALQERAYLCEAVIDGQLRARLAAESAKWTLPAAVSPDGSAPPVPPVSETAYAGLIDADIPAEGETPAGLGINIQV